MRVIWHIQILDGYTDGKPSWLKAGIGWTKEMADAAADQMRDNRPGRQFRVRKVTRVGRRT